MFLIVTKKNIFFVVGKMYKKQCLNLFFKINHLNKKKFYIFSSASTYRFSNNKNDTFIALIRD